MSGKMRSPNTCRTPVCTIGERTALLQGIPDTVDSSTKTGPGWSTSRSSDQHLSIQKLLRSPDGGDKLAEELGPWVPFGRRASAQVFPLRASALLRA